MNICLERNSLKTNMWLWCCIVNVKLYYFLNRMQERGVFTCYYNEYNQSIFCIFLLHYFFFLGIDDLLYFHDFFAVESGMFRLLAAFIESVCCVPVWPGDRVRGSVWLVRKSKEKDQEIKVGGQNQHSKAQSGQWVWWDSVCCWLSVFYIWWSVIRQCLLLDVCVLRLMEWYERLFKISTWRLYIRSPLVTMDLKS